MHRHCEEDELFRNPAGFVGVVLHCVKVICDVVRFVCVQYDTSVEHVVGSSSLCTLVLVVVHFTHKHNIAVSGRATGGLCVIHATAGRLQSM